jgi:RNA polymerase sigma-70 factor, ECF subfamily
MIDEDGPLPEGQTIAAHEVGDDDLARRARGDPDAFAMLYVRHVRRVYRYLVARLGDRQQAQDVTAQTFLAALEGIGGYRGQGQLAAWLLSIARNKAADVLRGRRPTAPLEDAARIASAEPPPEQVAIARMQLEEVVRALRAVAPERAEALALRVFGGLSVAEVGVMMGKSEAAVKMLVHRAVQDLRVRLAFGSEADS